MSLKLEAKDGYKNEIHLAVPFRVAVPFMTRQRHAELTGISEVIGKHRLVKVAALWRQAFEADGYL